MHVLKGDKARFKGDTVAIKETIEKKCYETGKTFLKEAKILESLNHHNLVNFKNVCYQPLAYLSIRKATNLNIPE